VWQSTSARTSRIEIRKERPLQTPPTAVVVLRGTLRVNGSEDVTAAEVGLFDRVGTKICVDSANGVTALLLSGEPIDESIVEQGPFVMSSPQEIRQAIADYQNGKMGHLR
jgi:redox-sensitive bicupin YhaK (pirin superfamily)